MSDDIQQEHQRLQQQLQVFLHQARENEQKMHRFHEQELRLIATRSLSELIEAILYNYRSEFELDTVSLMLFDPQYEIHRILEEEGVRLEEHPSLLFISSRDPLDVLFGLSLNPLLGRYQPDIHEFLFSKPVPELQSVALLPLVRYGELIGSFNLGSESLERFSAESATDFLQRLSTIIAICIENAANHERLKRVGLTDSLTGINNRRFFDQRLGEEIARGLRTHEPISCLFLDIDYFKKINDQYSHRAGDRVLRQVANLIREQLRNCDVLGRYGGEEFTALLANTGQETAMEIAERIREGIAGQAFTINDSKDALTIPVTISIGVATLDPRSGETDVAALSQTLMESADTALYAAKRNGRNQVMLARADNLSLNNVTAGTRIKTPAEQHTADVE